MIGVGGCPLETRCGRGNWDCGRFVSIRCGVGLLAGDCTACADHPGTDIPDWGLLDAPVGGGVGVAPMANAPILLSSELDRLLCED